MIGTFIFVLFVESKNHTRNQVHWLGRDGDGGGGGGGGGVLHEHVVFRCPNYIFIFLSYLCRTL